MNRKKFTEYLQHRINCLEAFLDYCRKKPESKAFPEVVKEAEIELRVLLEVLKEALNEFYT